MLIRMQECVSLMSEPPRGVIHVGAHLGEEAADYVSVGVRRVIWVEGNQSLLDPLVEETGRHLLENLYLSELLWDKDGEELGFKVTNNGQSSSVLSFGTHKAHYPHVQVVEERSQKAVRFDTIVRENNLRIDGRYQFVNLDIQGAELRALRGFGDLLDLPSLGAVYCEVNTEEVYQGCCLVGDLDEFLGSKGFDRVRTEMTECGWGDALYLKRQDPL